MHGKPALFSVEMQEWIGEGAEGKWEGGAGNREGRGNRVKNNSDNNLLFQRIWVPFPARTCQLKPSATPLSGAPAHSPASAGTEHRWYTDTHR